MKSADRKPVAKSNRGRPKAQNPKGTTFSIRFAPDLLEQVDAWAKRNGDIGRSAAIRLAVARLVNGRPVEN